MDRSWMATVAGILDILAGALGLLGVAAIFFASYMVGAVPQEDEIPIWAVQSLITGMGLLLLAAAVLAIVGGVFALQRTRFGWAVAGSIGATLCCPPLGVPAIVFTVLAERELEGRGAPVGFESPEGGT